MRNSSIYIRKETPADYHIVENVMREAFWNHYSPACSEHYLVHIMRSCPTFVHELDFVAEYNGEIVGSVMSLRSIIKSDDGLEYEVLSLGPIAVLPEYQHKGIGSQLIKATKESACSLGYRAILLCGDPDYYLHQGFSPAELFDIRTSDNMYMVALHVCELYPNALKGISGRYFEDDIYNVDEAEVHTFDKQFPPKEIIVGTPSQLKFEQVSKLIRPA